VTPSTTPTSTQTPTQTPTATATITPTGLTIRGRIVYAGSGAAVAGASVDLMGAQPASTQTDALGMYEFAGLSVGTWTVAPQRTGGASQSITEADAQTALAARVELESLTAEQALACDVTANGSVSGYDAGLILRFVAQLSTSFPAAGPCGSDWVFVPKPTPVPGASIVAPMPSPAACQAGAIVYDPLSQSALGQNFDGVAFGDCNGDWAPQP
jgi:hypothetical protein